MMRFKQVKRRICYKILFNYIISNNIELIYVRSELNANPFLVNFFRRLKQNNIKYLFDDRNQVIDMWWDNKLPVFHVGDYRNVF
jgi:hypothetical protein